MWRNIYARFWRNIRKEGCALQWIPSIPLSTHSHCFPPVFIICFYPHSIPHASFHTALWSLIFSIYLCPLDAFITHPLSLLLWLSKSFTWFALPQPTTLPPQKFLVQPPIQWFFQDATRDWKISKILADANWEAVPGLPAGGVENNNWAVPPSPLTPKSFLSRQKGWARL